MAVSDKDRDEYERGRETSKEDIVTRIVRDFSSRVLDSESEHAAFQKGRDGEQLDEDKKDE